MLFSKRKVRPQSPDPAATPDVVVAMEQQPRAAAEPTQPAQPRAAAPLPVAPQIRSAPTTPVEEAGATLTIDCGAIVANWRILGSRAAPADCAAVVKADAYGCGLEPVATALAAAGCETFFVAHLAEARQLRAVLPSAVIYVLNGIVPGTAHLFAEINARPVIGNLGELAEWDAFRAVQGWSGGAALHFDTGMSRLGLGPEEAPGLAARMAAMPNHGITLVMSHFACADEPNHSLNEKQIRDFRDIRVMFRGIPASLANSSGIFLESGAHFDLVRPGIALYGSNPTTRDNPMRPVVELKARLLQARLVPQGTSVGYGATWTARRTSRIAILSIGYADGYSRPIGGADGRPGGEAVVHGLRCPVVGRVSMDLIAVDITGLRKDVQRGDWITLLGDGIGIDEMAGWSRTISYDVLTRLGRRFHRVWKS
jgi:alanine racemase